MPAQGRRALRHAFLRGGGGFLCCKSFLAVSIYSYAAEASSFHAWNETGVLAFRGSSGCGDSRGGAWVQILPRDEGGFPTLSATVDNVEGDGHPLYTVIGKTGEEEFQYASPSPPSSPPPSLPPPPSFL